MNANIIELSGNAVRVSIENTPTIEERFSNNIAAESFAVAHAIENSLPIFNVSYFGECYV